MNIALLGAECTGKSTLAAALLDHFSSLPLTREPSPGPFALSVSETLRDWCSLRGRTPMSHEQAGIAHEQALALENARAQLGPHGVLVADTTPLMTAVYSLFYFQDASLLPFGLEQQRRFSHTLVTALDLPWRTDGIQRDGPATAQAVDGLLRRTLDEAGLSFQVIHGRGSARLAQALAVLQHRPSPRCSEHGTSWHTCAQCGDARAERQLFSRLVARPTDSHDTF